MDLPVTVDYLTLALRSEVSVGDMVLKHHPAGSLDLPTGQLVACDPFTSPDFLPLNLSFSPGSVPVTLSVAHIKSDQRVAFATLHLNEHHPLSWRLLTVGKQDLSKLRDGEYFGYPVDSGTGCFMDRSVGSALHQKISAEYEFCEELMEEMNKSYRHTWSWLNRRFADGNLVAFSSGYGDGMYATYAGVDSANKIAVVVTDFSVVPE